MYQVAVWGITMLLNVTHCMDREKGVAMFKQSLPKWVKKEQWTSPDSIPADPNAINHMFTSIVADYPLKTEDFYCRFFGFKRVRVYVPGGKQVVLINSGNSYLQIFPAYEKKPECLIDWLTIHTGTSGGIQVAPTYAGLSKISFFIDDIETKIKEMGSAAVIIKGLTNGLLPGSKLIWLRDPAGNTLELVQGYFNETSPPPLSPQPWNEQPIWK